jgi:hypothetical protein
MRGNILLALGFAFFGLLIGYVTGITSSAVAQTVLTALFAFIGGKTFIEFKPDDKHKNMISGTILILFSIFFLVGLNGGIYIKINKLLTTKETFAREALEQKSDKKVVSDSAPQPAKENYSLYLRSFPVTRDLQSKIRSGDIKCDSLITLILNADEK